MDSRFTFDDSKGYFCVHPVLACLDAIATGYPSDPEKEGLKQMGYALEMSPEKIKSIRKMKYFPTDQEIAKILRVGEEENVWGVERKIRENTREENKPVPCPPEILAEIKENMSRFTVKEISAEQKLENFKRRMGI